MALSAKRSSIFLVITQLIFLLTPSHAMFNILGGGGGDDGGESDVAEILAAGLITKMLMEDVFHIQSGSLFQPAHHQFSGGYSMQPRIPHVPHIRHYHPMQAPMMAPRIPVVMNARYVVPIMPRHPVPVHMVNHDAMYKQAAIMKQQAMMRQVAMMRQAAMMKQAAMINQDTMMRPATHPALPPVWNGRYHDLRGSQTVMNAYVPIRKPTEHSIIDELLTNEAISAATILLNSDLLDDEEDEEEEEPFNREEEEPEAKEEPEKQEETSSETIETSGSEHESRYILPRIVRHFVQRIMRRVEQHR